MSSSPQPRGPVPRRLQPYCAARTICALSAQIAGVLVGEEEGGMSKVKTKNLEPDQPWFAVPREKPAQEVDWQVVAVMMFYVLIVGVRLDLGWVVEKEEGGRAISWSSSRKPLATSLFGAVVASVHAPLAYDWLEPAQTIHLSDILQLACFR